MLAQWKAYMGAWQKGSIADNARAQEFSHQGMHHLSPSNG
jgi:hypothetical protein